MKCTPSEKFIKRAGTRERMSVRLRTSETTGSCFPYSNSPPGLLASRFPAKMVPHFLIQKLIRKTQEPRDGISETKGKGATGSAERVRQRASFKSLCGEPGSAFA